MIEAELVRYWVASWRRTLRWEAFRQRLTRREYRLRLRAMGIAA